MRKVKRRIWVFLTILAVIGMAPLQVFGAARIRTVSLVIDNDIKAESHYSVDDIEVTAKGGHYGVGEIEILNDDDNTWHNDDIPEICVTLYADDGYYFSVMKDDIRVRGGVYVSSARVDSYTMTVTVKLPCLLEKVGEITEAKWDSRSEASWKEAQNAGYYEVRLYRDGKLVEGIKEVKEPRIDFGSLMIKEGNYTFKVRAVNMRKLDVMSEWLETGAVSYIDSAAAEEMRSQYGNVIPEGVTEPGQIVGQSYAPDQYGWIHDDGGWWYRNGDGSYTTNNWQLINEKWYYFNSVGYMVTGWIDWNGKSYYCDLVNGDMLVSTMVPDGSGRRVDSTGAWFE